MGTENDMSEFAVALAKLAGIRKALRAFADENVSRNRGKGEVLTRSTFPPEFVQHYFDQTAALTDLLREMSPDLYGDFQSIGTVPKREMMAASPNQPPPMHFSRDQAEQLIRDIDQIFEIRANSKLNEPKQPGPQAVFITHGRSNDWRAVQPFIERDVGLKTIELAQEPNLGRTIIEKLLDNAARCDSAVIVMTGDDLANENEARVRENVMHEIGFFQGRYGRNVVILLYEEGVNIPTNLAGVAYIPFPKEHVEAGFHTLQRELKAIYKI
jgi:predicted nucleotide-binding protein